MMSTDGRPILTRSAFAWLWLFVFTIPMAQATEIPMISAISRLMGLAAMAAGVIAVVARRRVRFPGPLHMAMAGFILWSAVTLCWSTAPELTLQRVATYLQLFVLVLLVWELCVEEKDILAILRALVLGSMIPAVATLKAFLPGQQALLQRAATEGYDPNQLAFLLALSLPAAYYLILREKGALVSLYRLQMGFAVCAILLTGSASAIIGMAAGLSLVGWTFHTVSIRTRTNAFVIVMLLAGAAIALIPSQAWQGVSEGARKGDLTLTAVMNKGIDSVHRAPIGGYGAGTRSGAKDPGEGAPTAFTMFAETGAIGVLWFIVAFGVLVSAAERMRGIDQSFWFTSLAVWIVGVWSMNWDCSAPAWLMFGLLAAHSAWVRGEEVSKVEREQKRGYCFNEQPEVLW